MFKLTSLALCLSMIMTLVACGDSTPSASDVLNQILPTIQPCAELSITDFQKLNGYPQQDGSYVVNVQYNLVFTPSQEMLKDVNDWDTKLAAFKAQSAADVVQAEKINTVVYNMYNQCESNNDSNPSNVVDCGDQRAEYMQTPDVAAVFNRLTAINQQALAVKSADLSDIQNELNRDCPIADGTVLETFNQTDDYIDNYGKSYTLARSGTITMVQSDNGWVISQ